MRARDKSNRKHCRIRRSSRRDYRLLRRMYSARRCGEEERRRKAFHWVIYAAIGDRSVKELSLFRCGDSYD